jgi:hypothetical protein
MATQTWSPGAVGDWATGSNWNTGVPPATGDFAIVNSGFPIIDEGSTISGVQILLGGEPTSSTVILGAVDSTFAAAGDDDMQIFVRGGHPVTSPLHARFIVEGDTFFDGQIYVEPLGGSFTIEVASDDGSPSNFTFANTDNAAVMLVSQESVLLFEGDTITNEGLIQVDGGMSIAQGVTFGGTGIILLENGGHLTVDGTVLGTQHVSFADGTVGLTIADAHDFSAVLGLTTWGGATIDLQGVAAQAMSFSHTAGAATAELSFFGFGSGGPLATLTVQLLDNQSFEPLDGSDQTLTSDDFTFASDGHGGTVVTYTPQGPVILQQALPVPVVAEAGDTENPVPLSTILTEAFGTAWPAAFEQIILELPGEAPRTTSNFHYWQEPFETPQWLVNGKVLTQETYTVQPGDTIALVAGNQINLPVQFKALMTPADSSNPVYVLYDVWTVEPAVDQAVTTAGFTGLPTPDAIIASANAFFDTYGLVLNDNLCNWIADNVGAGAGAPMPSLDAQLDPEDNQSGGFWRIVYSGADPGPVANWSSKVLPGDVVRMGWLHPEDPTVNPASGHSTTVLAGVGNDGKITVYDNIYHSVQGGPSYIGIHEAEYWNGTNPADITIYRLDPAQQFLIQGAGVAEQIQGSVFNDLIQPNGGADTITGGPGNNEIQGTIQQLAAISVTDFGPGDLLDFTDLPSSSASVSFVDGALHVFSNNNQVASIAMPTPDQGEFFYVTRDGEGGTNIGLVDPATQIEMLYIGYLGRAGDPMGVQYWHSQLIPGDNAAKLKAMASSFAVQPETKAAYPFFTNPQQATSDEIVAFITAQYQELFGRTPDAPGLAYWQDYLTANLASPQAVGLFPLLLMFGAVNAALSVGGSAPTLDLTTLGNKTTVGAFMVDQFASAGIDFGSGPSAANSFAHDIIDQVNSTQDSVTSAQAAVIAFVEAQMDLVGIAP